MADTAGNGPATGEQPKVKVGSPNHFLKGACVYSQIVYAHYPGVIGKRVAVRLNSGIDYYGA